MVNISIFQPFVFTAIFCFCSSAKKVSGSSVSFIALVKARVVLPFVVIAPRFCVLFLDTFMLRAYLSTPMHCGDVTLPRLLNIMVWRERINTLPMRNIAVFKNNGTTFKIQFFCALTVVEINASSLSFAERIFSCL